MDGPTKNRSYDELAAALAKIEAEAGQHLVLQRDLNHAKDQVDKELMRFRSIQRYILAALESEDADAFYLQTLEAVIEAFEFEVAVFLIPCEDQNRMRVAAQFGLDEAADVFSVSDDWLTGEESRVVSRQNDSFAS